MVNINPDKLNVLKQKILELSIKYTRPENSVRLIGASKTRSADVIKTFYNAGLSEFGENYLDEALKKQASLTHLNITWHYIGSIQSRKTKAIANNFDWVHTVERKKIADRLNQHIKEAGKPPLNVLIQVNIDQEPSKSGVSVHELVTLAKYIADCPYLRLRGLMSIPKARDNFNDQLAIHRQLIDLKKNLEDQLSTSLDSVSAGMSNDMEAAIAAGSTMLRIGTDLFGKRR